MLNLKTFFRNVFNTKEISDANLNKFSESHIGRLSAANLGGIYNDQLADVQNAFSDFDVAMNAEDVAHAEQQGNTIAVDDIFYQFKAMASQKEGIVRGIWGVNSPKYQAFYPEGINEYSTATKANVGMLMNRMVAAATTYNAELMPDFLPLFDGIKINYTLARAAQLERIGEVETLKSATAAARLVLTKQLTKNLLIIASNHVGDTTMLEDFFDQSFIRNTAAPDDGSIVGTVAANTTINIESQGLSLDTEFTLTNNGTQGLHFGIQAMADTPVLGGTIVEAGATIVATYLQLLGGSPQGSTYLNVTNPSPVAGAYSVLIE